MEIGSPTITYWCNPNMGWICPRCNKVNSPYKEQCDCIPNTYIPYIPYEPITPWYPVPWNEPFTTVTLES